MRTVTQSGISVTDGATTTLNINLPVPINYVYDDLGRLVAVIDKDGNAATYAYDAVGKPSIDFAPGPKSGFNHSVHSRQRAGWHLGYDLRRRLQRNRCPKHSYI